MNTAPASRPETFEPREDADFHDVELVVLGAGGTGIAAALAAAERGVRVALLEKGNKPGGAAMFGATGFAAYGSPAQQEAGETFSAGDAFRAIVEHTGHRVDEDLVRAVLERSGETVSWLEEHGLRTQLAEAPEEAPPAAGEAQILAAHRNARTYHRYVSKFGGFKKLLRAFEEAGGLLLTETAAQEIVLDPDGRVLGIRAEKTEAGKPLPAPRASNEESGPRLVDVAARAVVVGTGGFPGNPEMLQEELPGIDVADVHVTGERKSVGTGREIVRAAGGDADAARVLDAPAFTVPGRYGSKALAVLANLPLLRVDRAGRRFADESAVYRFGERGSAVLEHGGMFWLLLDSATVARLAQGGLRIAPAEDHGAPLPPGTEGTPAQPALPETLEEAVAQGSAAVGDSLEKLAEAIGADPAVLAAQVERYNAAVASGRDEEFSTPAEILRHSVQEGPFHAVKAVTTVRGTLGGIRIDAAARVLDAAGNPVPGLFAGGNEATGFWGGSHPQVDGLTLMLAFNSGRIAGESAAEFLGK